MSAYCTADELYRYGLPRGELSTPARSVFSVDTTSNVLVLNDHGLGTDVEVSFRAESGGTLPSPLVEGTTYYATAVTASRFYVATTAGGAAIDLTTAGSRTRLIVPLSIEDAIEWASAMVEDFLPGHPVPLESPYPPIVRMTTAQLAVGQLIAMSGRGSEILDAMVDAAQKRIERWGRGVPLRGEGTSTLESTHKAVSASVPYVDARGWHRSDGKIP